VNGERPGRAQLLCAAAILVALGAVLALGEGRALPAPEGSAGTPTAKAPQALDPEELARISVAVTPRVARRVERLRELRFDRVPRPRVVSSEVLNRLARRELERAGGLEDIGADQAETQIVGLLAADEQLEDAYGTTGDLAAAAYDTRADRLYVIGDAVAPNRALVEFVIAHELNHALEDQRFGLPEGGPSDDAALARIALAEGSATALMTDYGTEYIPPLELLQGAAGVDSGTGGVPQFYLDQLLWAYTGGERFITELRELGGGWKLVDYALESRPPASTEQVIHTDKYLSDERPQELTLEASALQAEGWRRVDSGSLGELTTAQLLAVGAPQATANRAAAGWGGDEYGLWSRGAAPAGCEAPCREDLVFVIDWAWDSPGEVEEFERAAGSYVKQGLGGRSAGDDLWEVEGGSVALAAGGAETTLVFAPDTELAAAVAAEQVVP